MHPIIGAITGKIWGDTQCLFHANNVEIHRIRTKAGFQCSRHRHKGKFNLFHVISGRIIVRTTKDGLDDETTLGPGQSTVVRPGDYHQFESLQKSDVLEIYWVTLDPNDIERETQGGKANGRTKRKS